MKQPQKKSGKKKKKDKPTPIEKIVRRPRAKPIRRAAPKYKCHVCGRMVRVNKERFISWHRNSTGAGKWCPVSKALANLKARVSQLERERPPDPCMPD